MRNTLIIISTTLVLTSPIVYIRSILKGLTKPHRTTRFVITAITFLSAAALFSDYRSAAFWLAAASALQAITILLLTLRHGVGGWAKLDIICLVIAFVGVVFWQISNRPIVGLYASIVADFVGYVPAFVKTYRLPSTEDWRFFAMDSSAAFLSLLALATYSAFSSGYPIYLVLVNAGMVALILLRRRILKT